MLIELYARVSGSIGSYHKTVVQVDLTRYQAIVQGDEFFGALAKEGIEPSANLRLKILDDNRYGNLD